MPKRKAAKDDDEDYDPEGEDSQEEEPLEADDGDNDSTPEDNQEDSKQVQVKSEVAENNAEEPKNNTKPTRKKKLRRKINYESPEIDLLPSHERKTKAGGYAHTNKSKEKISMANRGNTPWNKGKQRSSADKAKIKAGVQARNRAIKLEKLRVRFRLAMTAVLLFGFCGTVSTHINLTCTCAVPIDKFTETWNDRRRI